MPVLQQESKLKSLGHFYVRMIHTNWPPSLNLHIKNENELDLFSLIYNSCKLSLN